jgi:SAM-dependent methyltransferase
MTGIRELYRAEQLPVFQNRMFETAQAARECTRGDVVLVQDLGTGFVFNRAFDPDLMRYDADYQNEQGHSGVFRQHLQSVSQVVARHLRDQTLIEVGCGKGHFLEQLQRDGFSITGLDPTYEGDNPAIRREYFTPATGLRADGLILRHVLEHVRDPVAFLAQLRDANGGGGKIYIEVPCLDWIAQHRAWFDLFYEHVNYFRLDDFERMFGIVHEAGRTFGEQYLYVMADLATVRTPEQRSVWPFEFPTGFLDAVHANALRLKRKAGSDDGAARAAIWGGASKGVIFALFMERAGAKIDLVVDINPAKQGKYIAATGLRVHSPDEALQRLAPGCDVFVMNRNYLEEIQELTQHQFNYITVEHEDIQTGSE